jgi:peptidoglycan/xylan/chitin deacetylase (PgdA/CDA1 family)
MNLFEFLERIKSHGQMIASRHFFRRLIEIHNSVPYISFTFDDFPRSALREGGAILLRHNLKATYYASFGLMGTEAPPGTVFAVEDIKELISQGHELGCHTFGHCHASQTKSRLFEESIIENKKAMKEIIPEADFMSFSYPISDPRPGTKRRAGRHFHCCRGGGQTFNSGLTDLNLLNAYFLEKCRDNPSFVKEIIDQNCKARGWLIFATHDISETPSPYGCTPSFFEEIVNYSLVSRSIILPVSEALESIQQNCSN